MSRLNGNGFHTNGSSGGLPDPMLNNFLKMMAENATTTSRMALGALTDPRRDIEDECGFPRLGEPVAIEMYRQLYGRDAIARRACEVMANECWQVQPTVYEDEDSKTATKLEQKWDDLGNDLYSNGQGWFKDEEGSPIWDYLRRLDVCCGIGHFGVLLLGIDDGLPLEQPAEGILMTRNRLQPIHNRQGQRVGTKVVRGPSIRHHDSFLTENAYRELLSYEQPLFNVKGERAGSRPLNDDERQAVERMWKRDRKLRHEMTVNAPGSGLKGKRSSQGDNYSSSSQQPTGRAKDSQGRELSYDKNSPMGTDQQYYGVQFGQSELLSDKPSAKKDRQLLFLRPYDESLVQVVRYEWDVRNPRFGQPVMYRVTLNDPREVHSGVGLPLATVFVHWSRLIHAADNCLSSEIFGIPRCESILNNLLGLRKLYGGSPEGYWKMCFTLLSLETHPQLGGDVEIDSSGLKDQVEQIQNSLQRVLTTSGMTLKSIAPSIVDPTPHITAQLEAICIQLACPVRVFKGSERGELASSQDDSAWNKRLRSRQQMFLTPRIIVPFVDRLIAMGVLPEPKDGYHIRWADVESLSDMDRATILSTRTTAYAAYAQGLSSIIAPLDFMTRFDDMEEDEAQEVIDAAEEQQEQMQADQAEQQQTQLEQQGEVMAGQQELADKHGLVPQAPEGFEKPLEGKPIKVKAGEQLLHPETGKPLHAPTSPGGPGFPGQGGPPGGPPQPGVPGKPGAPGANPFGGWAKGAKPGVPGAKPNPFAKKGKPPVGNVNPEGCNQYKTCEGEQDLRPGQASSSPELIARAQAEHRQKEQAELTKQQTAAGLLHDDRHLRLGKPVTHANGYPIHKDSTTGEHVVIDPNNPDPETHEIWRGGELKHAKRAARGLGPAANSNPEGCNQHTGPDCGGGGGKTSMHLVDVAGHQIEVHENPTEGGLKVWLSKLKPEEDLRGFIRGESIYVWDHSENETKLTHDAVGRAIGLGAPERKERFHLALRLTMPEGTKDDPHPKPVFKPALQPDYGKSEIPELVAWATKHGVTVNAFCPGDGARDNSCSPHGGQGTENVVPASLKYGGEASLTLYRAADDEDVNHDSTSFSEDQSVAEFYRNNPGFGGERVYRAKVEVDPTKTLDFVGHDDPVNALSEFLGQGLDTARKIDELVPTVSAELRDRGVHWVRVPESNPDDAITWIHIGGGADDPELKKLRPVANAFCPTGPGGGVDATCSPGSSSGQGHSHPLGEQMAHHGEAIEHVAHAAHHLDIHLAGLHSAGHVGMAVSAAGALISTAKLLGVKVDHLEHFVKSWAKDKVEEGLSKLPTKVASGVRKAMGVAALGTAALFSTYIAGQALAEKVSLEKGASPEESRRLRGVLSKIDVSVAKPVFWIGGTLPSFMPAGTAAYLAYNTAKDPMRTVRAARNLFPKQQLRDPFAPTRAMAANEVTDPVQALCDAVHDHKYDDWYIALLHQALDVTRDITEAVKAANEAYAKQPKSGV